MMTCGCEEGKGASQQDSAEEGRESLSEQGGGKLGLRLETCRCRWSRASGTPEGS